MVAGCPLVSEGPSHRQFCRAPISSGFFQIHRGSFAPHSLEWFTFGHRLNLQFSFPFKVYAMKIALSNLSGIFILNLCI